MSGSSSCKGQNRPGGAIWKWAAAAALVLPFCSSAQANVTYVYQGNFWNVFGGDCGILGRASYPPFCGNASDPNNTLYRIQASFTLAQPLPPNFGQSCYSGANTQCLVTPLSWTMTDGYQPAIDITYGLNLQLLSPGEGLPPSIYITTDSNGKITTWQFRVGDATTGGQAAEMFTDGCYLSSGCNVANEDDGDIYFPYITGNYNTPQGGGAIFGSPGTWTQVQQFITLTTTTSGAGAGGVTFSPTGTSCGAGCLSFAAGTVVTLTATPNAGSTFARWSGACSGTGACILTMNSNQAVNAAFNLIVYIDSVEITQAIQQYQTLADLQTSLTNNGEPPVPIIAGKPAVLRCYFAQAQDVTNVTVQLSSVSSQTKMLAVQPNCADAAQRAGTNGCQSMDFYFTPPSGAWQAVLNNLDTSGNVLQAVTLNVTSRSTNSIQLNGVSVCDALDANNNWLCANASSLVGNTTLLSKIAPTSSVSLTLTNNVVRENYATFMPGPGNRTQADNWWDAAVRDVNAYFELFDPVADYLAGSYTVYFGQIRPQLPGGTGGMAHGIPSHGAAGRTSAMRLGVETNFQVVAHETGHTLGLKHTNTIVPPAAGTPPVPPGCYNLAGDHTTDWPFANNYIQSTAMLEYGFDVPGRTIIDPNVTFEVMSYCVPRWVSPQRYKTMITTLGGGAVASPSVAPTAEARPEEAKDQAPKQAPKPSTSANPAQFWQVRGVIQNSTVQFGPLFQLTIQGNTSQGSGTYSLLELSSTGSTIFTRLFTPESPATETDVTDVTGPPGFSQVIPVSAGVAAIVVQDPTGLEIGRITLGGTAPTVSITSPGAGFVGTGTETVSWTIQNLNGNTSYSKVLYSADNGSTWAGIADLQNATSVPVDFDTLPGSNAALIQVLVSDGVNTGSATSVAFTVTKKTPMVEIDNPLPNSVQPAADPVYLSGSAYNPDVGMLTGAALAWSSNLQGALGTGSPLSVHLQPGSHTIQLKATDSEGNSVSTSVNVTIGGGPPTVGITATPQNTTPTTCEGISVTAQPGTNGAPLSLVQVSLNGGASYSTLPLPSLPYSFVAPGSGSFHLVARAYDISGQSNAQDVTFLTSAVCPQEACNVTNNLTVKVADVQLEINEALGASAAANDLNGDGVVNVIDVQYVMNAALNKGCGGA